MTFLDISIPEKKITEINIFTVKDITPSKEMIDDVSKQFKSFIKQNKYGCSRNFKINRFQLLSDSSYRVVFKTNCEKWECDFKKEIKPFGVSYSTVSYNQIN